MDLGDVAVVGQKGGRLSGSLKEVYGHGSGALDCDKEEEPWYTIEGTMLELSHGL